MNTSDIFKNLSIDIKEKITEHLIDELEVRYNKNMMIHELKQIHQYVKIQIEEYPDCFDYNDIIFFMGRYLLSKNYKCWMMINDMEL